MHNVSDHRTREPKANEGSVCRRCRRTTAIFSGPNLTRVFVYVNVYRFAVNAYGFPPYVDCVAQCVVSPCNSLCSVFALLVFESN